MIRSALVYGFARHHESLAFADARTAADEAQEILATASAKTRGAARAVRSRHISNPVPDYEGGPHDKALRSEFGELAGTAMSGHPPA